MRGLEAHPSALPAALLLLIAAATCAAAAGTVPWDSPPPSSDAGRAPLVVLEPFDPDAEELGAFDAEPAAGRRFGMARPVSLRTADGDWVELADGRALWTVELSSPGAVGLRLHFEGLRLPAGGRLFVSRPPWLGSAEDRHTVARGSLGAGSRAPLEAWSPTIEGETARVEYLAPSRRGALPFRLDRLQHHYLPMWTARHKNGCERIDALCSDASAAIHKESVALVSTIRHAESLALTGVMIANKSGGPLLVTSRMSPEEVEATEVFLSRATCGMWEPPERVGTKAIAVTSDPTRNFSALTIVEGTSHEIDLSDLREMFSLFDRSPKPPLPARALMIDPFGFQNTWSPSGTPGDRTFPEGELTKPPRGARCPPGQTAVEASSLPEGGDAAAFAANGKFIGFIHLHEGPCEDNACLIGTGLMAKNKVFDAAVKNGPPVFNPGGFSNTCAGGGRRLARDSVNEFALLGKQTLWASVEVHPGQEIRFRVTKPTAAPGLEVALYEVCPPRGKPYFEMGNFGYDDRTTFHYTNNRDGDDDDEERIVCLRLTRTEEGWDNPVTVEVSRTGS